MVRFRVIKGSRLLLGIAVVALALVLCVLALRFAAGDSEADATRTQGNLVQGVAQEGAEAASAVFASSSAPFDGIEIEILDPDGGGQASGTAPATENEHTDAEAAPILLDPGAVPGMPAAVSTPRVLIYHTHTHEAYEQAADDPYVALEAWRTSDERHSIVRVGAELAALLREHGMEVVHDATDHEQSDFTTAYARSLKTLTAYTQTFDLYIDLHRDSYVEGTGPQTVDTASGAAARLMLLIGKGDTFDEKPHFSENYAFARALTGQINAEVPGLCRDVLVKTSRYNQHIGIYAVLIEVGNNRNTLEEALGAMPALADALDAVLAGGASADPSG